jgi:N-acetylglucosaminyl-diphospho-decaprenol L-rhamnosyltransferase
LAFGATFSAISPQVPDHPPTLSVVIVTHDSREAVARTLPALVAQLREADKLIVVDNASADGTPRLAAELAPGAAVIETGTNLGFAAACNRGAEAATGELLCLLNPDAVPEPGWRDAIERPLTEGRGWTAWQALVTADGGRAINTRGGVVHFTGIAWAGGAGEAVVEVPPSTTGVPGGTLAAGDPDRVPDLVPEPEPGFVSGACLAIPRATYAELGGMPEHFFLYHEDVDLSLRARLVGGTLGLEPAARVDHDYEFAKGSSKWLYLERNRWATLIRTYPGALLALLAPALAATELALVVVAAAGGWLPQKLHAWGATLAALPRLLGERREIQARRRVGAGEFARALSPELDSPFLGAVGRSRALGLVLRSYWALVLVLLGARRR